VLNVLDAFPGALYLVILAIITIAVNILIFKTEFYDDALAFKSYYKEKIKYLNSRFKLANFQRF